MKIQVANPIYDSVFKHLVEDERVARILLSALLKKRVVDVKTRKHEYTNTTRNSISMFRIDFAAHVLQESGETKLVLIELQKTWVDAEVLRSRQYLGVQYQNAENIVKEDNDKGYATPMIAIYILGHRVGDITEPVIYVRHKAYNYDDVEVKEGMPDAFVESLVHDSIIVQLPLLNRRMNNRLEKVLSVFDQSRQSASTRQIIDIDENAYADDADMMYLLHRLFSAAADAEMRQQMNVEDEYFSAIEERDTQIMNQAQLIKEKEEQLEEKNTQLAEKEEQLAKQEEQLIRQKELMQNIVCNLRRKGLSVTEVAQITGKSTEEITSVWGE